jgi:hypothetical protein
LTIFAELFAGTWKDFNMVRRLSILVFSALCILPNRAFADQLKPHESSASEISSRQRCVCASRGRAHIVHYRHYRSVRVIYPIGYDPLPYRFGYFPEPYRYRHRVAILTARPYHWR